MKKTILIILGFIALGMGGIGIVLPILPTTPFVLMAATCFGGSSPKLYQKLKNTKGFGEFIENYANNTGIEKPVKIKAIVFLWTTLIISAIIFKTSLNISILTIVGVCVTTHIIMIKGKK